MHGKAAAMEAKHGSDEHLRFRKGQQGAQAWQDSSAVLLNGVKDPIGSMQLLGA